MSYLSLYFVNNRTPKDLAERASDLLLYPARVTFRGHSIDLYTQHKQPLTTGIAHRIAMAIVAFVTCLLGVLGLVFAKCSTTRREALQRYATRTVYEDLPHDAVELVLDTIFVRGLGKFAASSRRNCLIVNDKLKEVLQIVEKELTLFQKALREKLSALEAQEKEGQSVLENWLDEMQGYFPTEEPSGANEQILLAITRVGLLGEDISALQEITRHQDQESLRHAIQGFMRKVFGLIPLPKDLQVCELAHLIVRIYQMAHEYNISLMTYLEEVLAPLSIEKAENLEKLLSDYYKDDEFAMSVAIARKGRYLKLASDRLRDDFNFVKMAIIQDSSALEYASSRLKNDPAIVKIAVAKDGWALRCASSELRDCPDIVKLAITSSSTVAFYYASDRLKGDFEMLKWAVAKDELIFRYASDQLKDNPELVKMAVARWGGALKYVSERLRDDREIVMLAMDENAWGQYVKFASERLRDDFEIIKRAVSKNGLTLQFASNRLRRHPAIIKLAIEQNPAAANFAK